MALEIKVIAIDLDGTLLDDKNNISKKDIQAIKEAQAQGFEVVPCTGRLFQESEFVLDELKDCRYSMHCNGAMICDHKTGEYVSLQTADDQQIKSCIDLLESYDTFYQVYTAQGACCPKRLHHKLNSEIFSVGYVERFYDQQILLENPVADIKNRGLDVIKYYMSTTDNPLLKMVSAAVNDLPGMTSAFSSDVGLEIFSTDIGKQFGLQKLLSHLSLGFENLMMIGDSQNDVLAIQQAAFGVCMSGGAKVAMEVADFITGDNNNSGVATAIYKMLEDQKVV